MFQNALKIALRNFIKERRFTLLNLAGLSSGLACTLLIFLWVSDERQMDRFHRNTGQLYQVMVNQKNSGGIQTLASTNALLARALKAEMPEVEYAAAAVLPGWTGKVPLTYRENTLQAEGQFVDADYLRLFTYPLTEGNPDGVLRDKNSIVISRRLATKLFPTTDHLIGKTLTWQGQQACVISGIMEDVPGHSSVQFDFLVSMERFLDQHPWERTWANSDPATYVLLKKGTDIQAFNRKRCFCKNRLKRGMYVNFIH